MAGHSNESKPPKVEPNHVLDESKNSDCPLNIQTSNSALSECVQKISEDAVILNNLREHEETTHLFQVKDGLPWSDEEVTKDKSRKEWEDQNHFSKSAEVDLPKLAPKALKCPVCIKEFSNHHKTYIHFQNHYPRYLCEMCGKNFSEKQRFQSHMDAHLSIKISCPDCKREYANADALRCHIKAKHQHHLVYTCSECNERFHNFYWRKEHMLAAHGVAYSRYSCPECAEGMQTRRQLFRHLETMHR